MDILGFEFPTWVILFGLLLLLLYIHGTWTFHKFSEIGLPGPKPLPYLGNMLQFFKKGLRNFDREVLKQYGSILGFYEGRNPTVLVSDPDLLKQIMVKDFPDFVNRRSADSVDPPFNKMLTALKNDQWKRVRSLLTPAFSSGKLRQMMSQLNKCAQWFVEYVNERTERGEPIDLRKCGGAFSMDVIAGAGFGIETNSLKNPDDKFVDHAQNIFKPRLYLFFSFFLFPWLHPILHRIFGVNMFPKDSTDFFLAIIRRLLDVKTEDSNRHQNLTQIMKNAHLEQDQLDEKDIIQDRAVGVEYDPNKHHRKGMTMEEITGQAFVLFIGGSETTGNTLTFFAYAMATNQDVQDKLIAEIDDNIGDEESITMDMIEKMTYMEQCLSECLRMYNPALRLDRVANNDVELKGYKIPKGTLISIAIDAIHHNPEFWPEPETFDPERFSPENKPKIVPMTYIPFGFGPRNCIGMRLALLELKIVIIRTFQNFRLKACDKTPDPLVYERGGLLRPKGELWLMAEQRKN